MVKKNELKPGQLIEEYRLEERLGRGAMGEVWKAWGPNGVVALKIPRQPEYLRHLRQEESLLKEIHHSSVARLHKAQLEGPVPYLVMEYIDGNPLRTYCNGKITSSEATLLADQILEGLQAIHQAGYLHLDLKPENVLVLQDGSVKIVDLGLGKATINLMVEVYLSASLVSRDVPLAGTLAYMAPEQRKAKELDQRTDLFAFGILLHELLSGRLPDPTIRLSQMRNDLPPRWDVVIAKLTHPQKENRPVSAREARQLISFSLVQKDIIPLTEGGVELRDVATLDQKALGFLSPYRQGMTVGNWVLDELLGRGGYGEVWKAQGENGAVAIKLALNQKVQSALVGEAKIMASLDHPAIPKILEDGTDQDPAHLVLELMEGHSLRLLLNEYEKFSWKNVLPFFSAMAKVLLVCHNQGIIHGDLKPEHFIICGPSSPFPIRLFDFGLSGLEDSSPLKQEFEHSLATRENQGGTFDYMAPEQKRGELCPESDIYSLGICIFEMISGALPRGPQSLKMLCREVPEGLDKLVLAMLDKNPKKRPSLEKIIKATKKIGKKVRPSSSQREQEDWQLRWNRMISQWTEDFKDWLIGAILISSWFSGNWKEDSLPKFLVKFSISLVVKLLIAFGITLVLMAFYWSFSLWKKGIP